MQASTQVCQMVGGKDDSNLIAHVKANKRTHTNNEEHEESETNGMARVPESTHTDTAVKGRGMCIREY